MRFLKKKSVVAKHDWDLCSKGTFEEVDSSVYQFCIILNESCIPIPWPRNAWDAYVIIAWPMEILTNIYYAHVCKWDLRRSGGGIIRGSSRNKRLERMADVIENWRFGGWKESKRLRREGWRWWSGRRTEEEWTRMSLALRVCYWNRKPSIIAQGLRPFRCRDSGPDNHAAVCLSLDTLSLIMRVLLSPNTWGLYFSMALH